LLIARVAGRATQVLNLPLGKFDWRVLLERTEPAGGESTQGLALFGIQDEVRSGTSLFRIVSQTAFSSSRWRASR
jgi:hypothetical protein